MNSSEGNSQTPLRYKHSPVVNFLSKNGRALFSQSSSCTSSNLTSHGQHSRKFKETNSFHVFPMVKTPPNKRYVKVVNPFEAALTERLHLPLIGSPTLFHRPPTPQHSSTQFAWTIDDVSSLQPANVEPHETQFNDSPDPEVEAKAQSAISSYFKDQQIVPSPIDCPLRSQRIILSEITGNTPISKPGRRIRDNSSQTVLSLPPKLPKDLEDALAPYFVFNENQQSTNTLQNVSIDSISAIDHDQRDASLRRKLFGHPGAMYCDEDADEENLLLTVNSPPPQSPDVISSKVVSCDEPFHNSKLSESMGASSFGSLSPIGQSVTPYNLKRKSRISVVNSSRNDVSTSRPFSCFYGAYRCPKDTDFNSPLCKKSPMYHFVTPDRNLVNQNNSPSFATNEISIDSAFNVKVNGLVVDTTKRIKTTLEIDLFGDETQDVDEDDMQISQLSAISSISSESDTPRSKRRSASRKNLSQSFSLQSSNKGDVDEEIDQNDDNAKKTPTAFPQVFLGVIASGDLKTQTPFEQVTSERSILCRTDSGFNEMTTSCTQFDIRLPNEKTAEEKTANISDGDADVSMLCCSTPSKHSNR